MDADKPLFNGNLFEYEGGVMYFHGGIDAFCAKYEAEIVEIREDGSVWVMLTGTDEWLEWPQSKSKPKLGVVRG
jgi:hypothetical protein